jgi:hypothetical protein
MAKLEIDYRELKHLCESKGTRETCQLLADGVKGGHINPDAFSLREAALEFMGREWVDGLHPKRWRNRLTEASGAVVAYSQFSNITGQIAFSTIMQGYDLPEFVFSKVVPTKSTDILDTEKIPGIAEIGDEFTTVEEDDEYPFVGTSEDWIEVAAKTKRGAIVKVTKEAILGDRTGLLLERCRRLGQWLGLNREKRIIDAVIDENGGATSIVNRGHRYHWKGTSYATFQASTPWVNIKTSNGLVDWTDIDNAWLLLTQMTDPYTGEPIWNEPTHLIVTPQNYHVASHVLRATQVRRDTNNSAGTLDTTTVGPSPIAGSNWTILSSALLAARAGTDTDWWFGNPAAAVNYYSIWDMETEELGTDSAEAFRRDVMMQFKASEMGAAAVVQPRALIENQQ